MRVYSCAAVLMAPLLAGAQPSNALIEACNAVANPVKRLACLKEAISTPQAKIAPSQSVDKSKPAPLDTAQATAICDSVFSGLQKRREAAAEDASLSTPSELVVIWPGLEGKTPTYCNVDRSTRKILAFTINGKVISGTILAQIEKSATEGREFQAGNYSNFVARAKASIASSVKDPSSVQFQSLFISGTKLAVLCGELNGKNSYGAYVGFRRFYSTGEAHLNEIENPRDNYVFDRMWPSMCGEKIAAVD